MEYKKIVVNGVEHDFILNKDIHNIEDNTDLIDKEDMTYDNDENTVDFTELVNIINGDKNE